MALGFSMMALLGSRLRVSYRTPLTGCARDVGTGGASGMARWADRMGYPVRFLEVPLWEAPEVLPAREGNGVVTMGNDDWSPMGGEMGPAEWASARDWLARGNTLIVATTEPDNLPRVLREDLTPWVAVASTPSAPNFFRSSVDNRADTDQAPVKGGGVLTVEKDGPRWEAVEEAAARAPAKAPAPPPPPPDPKKDPARWELAGDSRGGVLFRMPVGRGAVYVLLDDFAWTNAGLDRGDNARVLAAILGGAVRGGGAVAIDEYRHGHGRTESFLVYLMDLPGASAAVWLGALWVILAAIGRVVRLKPAEPYLERERRTAQEYIDAVARLYERARAAPLVVEAVARRLRQVSRSPADPPREVEALLHAAEAYTRAGDRPAAPNAAIRLVKELIQIRKKVYGTRTVS